LANLRRNGVYCKSIVRITEYRVNSRQLDIGTNHLCVPTLSVRYCRSFTS